MNDKPLTQSTVAKCLGIFIDDKLSWANHVQCLCKKTFPKDRNFLQNSEVLYLSKNSLVSRDGRDTQFLS